MAKATAASLTRIIRQLRTERQQYVDAINAIDEQFAEHGIAGETRKRRR